MANDEVQLSPSAKRFAMEIEEARFFDNVPGFFYHSRLSIEKSDEICILRRWNSHTPSVRNVWGGGYFIRWRGRGTIIDPGCSFIRLFRSETPYEFGDIHMVITTHDHVDHCQDFGTLISLLREYNKWLDKQGTPPRTWDLLISHGVADQFSSFLVHPENSLFLRWNKILFPEDVEQVQPLPSIAQKKSRREMLGWKKHLSAYSFFCQKKISQDYKYRLKLIPTRHKELLGGRTALGIQLKLIPSGTTIVISGDTGYDDKLDLAEFYREAHLLILHVGTMEDTAGKRNEEHLGLNGVTKVLFGIGRREPKLVILTEWGYEFGRLQKQGELGGRSRFTRLVEERLRGMGCDAYYAAVSPDRADGKIPIIPADISLRINLPYLQIWSEDENNGKGGFVRLDHIWADDRGDQITYHTI